MGIFICRFLVVYIFRGQQRDLVLLKISASQTASLSLGDSDKVEVGDSVFAIGNPQGLEGTFSQGIVSSIREIGSDKLLQITAPISPGSSGGPVLNSEGEVIGVSVATFRDGQNLNFAIPSNYLNALILKADTLTPLASKRHSFDICRYGREKCRWSSRYAINVGDARNSSW